MNQMFSRECITDDGMATGSYQKWGSRKRNASFLKPAAPTLPRVCPELNFYNIQFEKHDSKPAVTFDNVYSEMADFGMEHAIFPIALSAVIKSNESILKSDLPDVMSFTIDRFVDAFRSFLKKKKSENHFTYDDHSINASLETVFHCQICKNVINDPVTIGCGHSFCRSCISRNTDNLCCVCDVPTFGVFDNIKSSVILSKCIESCFVNNRTINKLKEEGNAAMKRESYHAAIEKYSKALQLGTDHILLSNRSYAFLRLSNYDRALSDANEVVAVRPDWPKGYYRRGAALLAQGLLNEAATALCHCLRLDPNIGIAKDDLRKCLSQILGDSTPVVSLGALAEQCSGLFRSACSKLLGNLASMSFTDLITLVSSSQLTTLLTSGHTLFPAAAVTSVRRSGSSHSLTDSLFRACHADGGAFSQPSEAGALGLKPAMSVDDMRIESRSRLSDPVNEQRLFRTLNKDDFECSLCLRLFYDPITTKCGHSFCRQCLERCLDHKAVCPLCKESLTEFFAGRKVSVTHAFQQIMRICWPQEYLLRKQAHDEEMDELAKAGSDQRHEIPIFLCTLAYPGLPCPLHVFEPRYRLMIRRCMESGTRQFGITINLPSSDAPFIDVGTLLEIRHIEYLPDGRSILDTRGGRRFRVLERSMRDGYHTAKVEFMGDEPVSAAKKLELNKMCEKVRKMVDKWYESLPDSVRAEIERHYGSIPEHEISSVGSEQGPAWLWWLTAVLPVDTRIQVSLIGSTSLESRLNALHRVLKICLAKSKKSI